MDEITNPYAPGAGVRPPELAGRHETLRTWTVALERIASGRHGRSIALYGLRGVGKTVLISEFARKSRERSWITAKIEADPRTPLRQALVDALHDDLVDLARPSAGAAVLRALKTALSFRATYSAEGTWSFGLDLSGASGGGADTGAIDVDVRKLLRDLASAARERGAGVCILVDEAQDLGNDELAALCSALHAANQDGDPMVMGLAGLPRLPELLSAAESYAERLFEYRQIDSLAGSAARDAIVLPAADEGVTWSTEAVETVLRRSSGYPYFIQQFAFDTWNAAPGSPITATDADIGSELGVRALDRGFFRSRWDRATRTERDYMRSLAHDGDEASSSDVAARLGRTLQSLGPTRAKLIDKGLVFAPDHGRIAFTVPGMAEFIDRQAE